MEIENTVVTPSQQDDAAVIETDVQEDSGAVTIEEVLGEGETVEQTQDDAAAQGEEDTTLPGNAQADPQKDIDKALGQRLHAEREKAQRRFMEQYGEDIRIAQTARQILGDNPMDRLIQSEVQQYAKKNGVSEEVATDLVRWKRGLPPVQAAPAAQRDHQGRFTKPEQAPPANPAIDSLVSQAQAIQDSDGVNMIEVLKTDEVLRDKVQNGGWDINRAYGYHLAQKANPPPTNDRPAAPSIVRGGARPGVGRSIANMSAQDFKKMEDAVRRGAVVKL